MAAEVGSFCHMVRVTL